MAQTFLKAKDRLLALQRLRDLLIQRTDRLAPVKRRSYTPKEPKQEHYGLALLMT